MALREAFARLEQSVRSPNMAQRIDFYDTMADTLSEGLPQFEVLQILSKEYEKTRHPLAPIVKRVLSRLRGLEKGSGVAQRSVGTELTGLLPSEEVALIVAGESSGAFEKGWRNAARYARQSRELKSRIMTLLAKPLLYTTAFVGLLLFFSFYLLPRFEKSRPRANWPADAQLLGWVADNVIVIVALIIGGLITFSISMTWLNHNWVGEGRATADRKLPFFKAIAQIRCANLMSSLSAFMSSGVSFGESLQRIGRGGDPYLRWQAKNLERALKNGKRPEQALQGLSMMDASYHWIVSVYGMLAASNAAQAYERIAETMMSRTLKRLELVIGSTLSNVILLGLAVGIMWIYFGMFSIVQSGLTVTG